MKGRTKRTLRGVAVAILAIAVAGCSASDPIAESIHASMEEQNRGAGRADSLMRVAASTAAAGDHATASALYRRAHGIDPQNAVPLVGLGKSLAALGAYEEAAESYRQALKFSPDHYDALHGLGNSLIALDQPSMAISHYEAMLKLRDEARIYNGLGVAYDMLSDHASAQAYYRTGLKASPGNMTLRNNLGLSLALAGKFKEGIMVLRSVAADPRAGSRQRLNLALVYGLAGKFEAAAEIARIDLDEASVRRNLAYYRTLRALKDPRAALKAIGAAGTAPGSSAVEQPPQPTVFDP